MPRSIRPSAASGLGRDGRPGLDDLRSFASGRGSRAPWRGGASLAGRSASSRLRAILSIRPRGPPPVDGWFRPLEARERAVRTKAPGASTSRRVYGRPRSSVKPRPAPGGPGVARVGPGWLARVRPGSTLSRAPARRESGAGPRWSFFQFTNRGGGTEGSAPTRAPFSRFRRLVHARNAAWGPSVAASIGCVVTYYHAGWYPGSSGRAAAAQTRIRAFISGGGVGREPTSPTS